MGRRGGGGGCPSTVPSPRAATLSQRAPLPLSQRKLFLLPRSLSQRTLLPLSLSQVKPPEDPPPPPPPPAVQPIPPPHHPALDPTGDHASIPSAGELSLLPHASIAAEFQGCKLQRVARRQAEVMAAGARAASAVAATAGPTITPAAFGGEGATAGQPAGAQEGVSRHETQPARAGSVLGSTPRLMGSAGSSGWAALTLHTSSSASVTEDVPIGASLVSKRSVPPPSKVSPIISPIPH